MVGGAWRGQTGVPQFEYEIKDLSAIIRHHTKAQ